MLILLLVVWYYHIPHITFLSSSNSAASLVCSGLTTPRMGYVPFFYVKCQNTTYLGPDPYHFSPPFGSQFPGHGNKTNGLLVRSYVCNGMIKSSRNLQADGFYDYYNTNNDDVVTDDDSGIGAFSGESFVNDTSVRPSWKMIGFFPVNNCTSSLGESNTYDESVCNANPTSVPTSMPTATPTTPSPTSTPTTPSPTATPTTPSPTATPTSKPTSTPTSKPIQQCLNVGWRLSSYGIRCACNTLRCYGADTSGRCCSGKCRITSRGVSVCRP